MSLYKVAYQPFTHTPIPFNEHQKSIPKILHTKIIEATNRLQAIKKFSAVDRGIVLFVTERKVA